MLFDTNDTTSPWKLILCYNFSLTVLQRLIKYSYIELSFEEGETVYICHVDDSDVSRLKLMCEWCTQHFNNSYTLRKRVVVVNSKNLKYKCKMCNKQFFENMCYIGQLTNIKTKSLIFAIFSTRLLDTNPVYRSTRKRCIAKQNLHATRVSRCHF